MAQIGDPGPLLPGPRERWVAGFMTGLIWIVLLVSLVPVDVYTRVNPEIPQSRSLTVTGTVIAGCRANDSRNFFACSQELQFADAEGQLHRAQLFVSDTGRKEQNNNQAIVVFDSSDPSRARLVEGNPTRAIQIAAQVFYWVVSLAAAWIGAVSLVCGCGRARSRGLGLWRRL